MSTFHNTRSYSTRVIIGLSVPTKNNRIKKSASLARLMKSILSGADKTVSKHKLFLSSKQFSRSCCAYWAAFSTASGVLYPAQKNRYLAHKSRDLFRS